jgi:hypothetical protein
MGAPLIHSASLPDGRSYLAVLARRSYRLRPGARAVPSGEDAPIPLDLAYAPSTNPGAKDRLVHDSDEYGVQKAFTDVLLRGSAHAQGRAVTVLETGLQVDRARKAVRVWGDRRVDLGAGGAPFYGEPAAFTTLPLVYDHAFGGCDEVATKRVAAARAAAGEPALPGVVSYPRNDAGRGYVVDASPERLRGLVAPNLEDPTDPVTADRLLSHDDEDWIDLPVAACYGPIDCFTFPRSLFFVAPEFREPRRPVHEIALGALLPEDLALRPTMDAAPDPRVYNAAPAGLAVCRLRGGERVKLWNLHPRHELLELDLPGEEPRLVVELPGVGSREPAPFLHTVLIEPDDDRVTLAWAGWLEVAMPYPEEMTRALRRAAVWPDGSSSA